MLLPRAEANLTALISEHNKQLQQLQLQVSTMTKEQQDELQKQLMLQRPPPENPAESLPGQPPAKRPKLSKRGRKRHMEGSVQPLSLSGVSGLGASKRSSLGSVAVSVNADGSVAGAAGTGAGAVMRKGPWLAEEDSKLLELVEQFGAYDWSFIAEHIPGRVGKQCRERYFNHLAPDVRKEAWTDHEDDAIVHAHHVVGNKWTNIAKMLGNGRSPNSIKNRWHSSLKNRLGEHGGEASVMEVTGAASGCQCDCKKCGCSCKVACVAFGCQCCLAAHSTASDRSDEVQNATANSGTDDEYATGGSTSSSVSTTPASSSAASNPPAFSGIMTSAS